MLHVIDANVGFARIALEHDRLGHCFRHSAGIWSTGDLLSQQKVDPAIDGGFDSGTAMSGILRKKLQRRQQPFHTSCGWRSPSRCIEAAILDLTPKQGVADPLGIPDQLRARDGAIVLATMRKKSRRCNQRPVIQGSCPRAQTRLLAR